MATRALQSGRLAVNYIAVDRRCDRFMAAAACILCDLVIELGDLDGVGISAACEIEGMPESVVRLDRVLPTMLCGVWQSLQVATEWWLDFIQASYCACITWQLAHAAGLLVRYEYPLA